MAQVFFGVEALTVPRIVRWAGMVPASFFEGPEKQQGIATVQCLAGVSGDVPQTEDTDWDVFAPHGFVMLEAVRLELGDGSSVLS
ncbi:MAG: hypothetical protein AAFY26_13045 [Cyanobacteria bacterium J06638_22]